MFKLRIIKSNYMITSMFACLLIAYGISGSTNENANMIFFSLTVLWFLTALAADSSTLIKTFYNPSVRFCIFFLLIYMMDVLIRNDFLLGIKCLALYICYFSPLFLYCYFKQLKNKYYINLVLSFSILIICWYGIKALVFYTKHIEAARFLASDNRFFGDVAIGGGYALAYLFSITVVFLLGNYGIKKQYLPVICIGILVVLKTHSSITTLVMLMGIGLAFLFQFIQSFHNRKNRVIIVLSAVVCLFLLLLLKQAIGQYLVSQFKDMFNPVGWRMTEVGNLLQGNSLGSESATNLRLVTYYKSLDIIKNNPLLGELLTHGMVLNTGNTGGHSEILDIFAGWGFFVGGLYLSIFIFWFVRLNKSSRNCAYMVTALVMMLLNPCVNFHFCMGIFFIIPTINHAYPMSAILPKLKCSNVITVLKSS